MSNQPSLLEAAEAAYDMLYDWCDVPSHKAIEYEQVILDLKIAIARAKQMREVVI